MSKIKKFILLIVFSILLLYTNKSLCMEKMTTESNNEIIDLEEKEDISNVDVNEILNEYYTGTKITPKLILSLNNVKLKENLDYKLEYSNNINVGTANIKITGEGKYKGTINKSFKIIKTPISRLSIFDVNNQVYTGKNITPDVTIKNGKNKLKLNTDYTLSYKNNKNFGEATITITLKGNYTGKTTKTFNIIPQQVTNVKISTVTEKNISLTWNKVKDVTGYRVYIYNNSKKQYEYYGSITKNLITIKNLSAGVEKKVRIRAYKKIDSDYYFGEYSKEFLIGTKPSEVKGIKTTKRKPGSIELNWNKVSGATGYKIYIYNSSKKQYEYYGATKTNSITVKNLNSARSYNMKIRAYKAINGTKYYGKYSNFIGITSPKKVTGVTISSTTSNTINLKWNAVKSATNYRIYIYNNSKKKYEYYGSTTKNSISIKKLLANTDYKIRVRACKRISGTNYFGEYCTPIIAVTKINKVTNLKVSNIKSTSLKVQWDKVNKADGYRVYIDKNNKGSYTYYGSTTTNSITISNLLEKTNYGIKVRAYKKVNGEYYFGPYSSVLKVKTSFEVNISNKEYKNTKRLIYGKSGQGRDLVYYQIGNASANNVMILNFAIHGYEDAFAQDGYELVLVAHKLIKYLSDNINIVKNNDWCIYIIPCANPDGVIYTGGPKAGNCDGIGRKTYYILNKDGSKTKGGVDLNRCFPYNKAGGFKKYTSERNYTGNNAMMAKEAVALNNFILSSSRKNVNGNKIFIDVHGWYNQIITTSGSKIYTYLNNQFKYNVRTELNTSKAYGYLAFWALKNGYDSCLFEFPSNVTKEGDVARKGYDTKFVNSIVNIVKGY